MVAVGAAAEEFVLDPDLVLERGRLAFACSGAGACSCRRDDRKVLGELDAGRHGDEGTDRRVLDLGAALFDVLGRKPVDRLVHPQLPGAVGGHTGVVHEVPAHPRGHVGHGADVPLQDRAVLLQTSTSSGIAGSLQQEDDTQQGRAPLACSTGAPSARMHWEAVRDARHPRWGAVAGSPCQPPWQGSPCVALCACREDFVSWREEALTFPVFDWKCWPDSHSSMYIGPGHSAASRFLESHRAAKGESANLLSLAGGTFQLATDEHWRELYRKIAEDVASAKPNFLVQLKSDPVFPLFFDVGEAHKCSTHPAVPLKAVTLSCVTAADLTHPGEELPFLLERVLPLVCKGVCKALIAIVGRLRVLVTVGPSTDAALEDGTPARKSGLHCHVLGYDRPDGTRACVVVDTDTGRLVRAAVIAELVGAFPDRDDLNWRDVIDLHCMTANGLRMLFSFKAAVCRDCSKLRRQAERAEPCARADEARALYRCPCARCRTIKAALEAARAEHGCSFGKCVSKRCYSPYAGYAFEPATDRLTVTKDLVASPEPVYEMLLATSVRIFDVHLKAGRAPLTAVRKVALPPALRDELAAEGGPVGKRRKRKAGGGGGCARPLGSGQGDLLDGRDPRHKAVEELLERPEVAEHFPEAAADLQKVVVLGPGRLRASMHLGHCKLAGREHASNNTFMNITPGLVAQGCWDSECRCKPHFEIKVDTPAALFE